MREHMMIVALPCQATLKTALQQQGIIFNVMLTLNILWQKEQYSSTQNSLFLPVISSNEQNQIIDCISYLAYLKQFRELILKVET